MSDKYTETKELMNHMSHVKMMMNQHKGDIEDCNVQLLLSKISEEIDELNTAIAEENYLSIIEEASDIQNYLVAIVHQQIRDYRNRK